MLYARALDRPASVPLVPGSVGFRSIAAFAVGLIATALVTGLLLAQVLVPPRRSL